MPVSGYYPDGNLLNAGLKKGSSFTWQSIVSELQTFKRGHIWRVGNGKSINIWKDHWVSSNWSRKIDSARGQVIYQAVKELVDPGTGQWDEVLIREIFNPLEARRILQIPISPDLEEDFVAWHKSKSYIFSIRSAYYTEWEHQYGEKLGVPMAKDLQVEIPSRIYYIRSEL